jgi:hypothetical protein
MKPKIFFIFLLLFLGMIISVNAITIHPGTTLQAGCKNGMCNITYFFASTLSFTSIQIGSNSIIFNHEPSCVLPPAFITAITYDDIFNSCIGIQTQKGITTIGNTEYTAGELGKLGVRLVKVDGSAETAATCHANILYPNQSVFINNANMTAINSTGIYTYDFTTASTTGVYVYYVDCTVGTMMYKTISSFHISPLGSTIGAINQTVTTINQTVSTINQTTTETLAQVSSSQGVTFIGGTEYKAEEMGEVAVRIVKGNGDAETGATCLATILYPNKTAFVNASTMSEFGSGIYNYSFTVPTTEGVYDYFTDCTKTGTKYKALSTFHVSPWANKIDIRLLGTDYEVGDNGRTIVQLIKDGIAVDNAVCKIDVYKPSDVIGNITYYLNDAVLTSMGENGVYYYDFTAPTTPGSYSVVANCTLGKKTMSQADEWNIRNHLTAIKNNLTEIKNIVTFINSTTIEINGTTHNIYSYLQTTVNSLLTDINYTVQNMNVSVGNVSVIVDLNTITTRLDTMQGIVSKMDQFNQEQIFLITDSVGQVKQISTNTYSTEGDIKQTLENVQANLLKFQQITDTQTKTNDKPNRLTNIDGGVVILVFVIIGILLLSQAKGLERQNKKPPIEKEESVYRLPTLSDRR